VSVLTPLKRRFTALQINACKRTLLSSLCIFITLLLPTIAFSAPKVETIGPCTDSGVPELIRKALTDHGYRATLDDTSVVELWTRSEISGSANKSRDDATYGLTPSTFVGVIHFGKNTRDYRGNAVAAGFYNLRYELQPSDGDHLGTSPTPDFLLLVPPGSDSDPAQNYSFEQLVALSKVITKKHPGVLNLAPPDAKEFPSVATDPDDHTILFFKVKTQSGEIPIGLVIKGTTTG
jgi:hypothetical protein